MAADDVQFEVTADLAGLKKAFRGLFDEIKAGGKEIKKAFEEGMVLEKTRASFASLAPIVKVAGLAISAAGTVGFAAWKIGKDILGEVQDALQVLFASMKEWVGIAIEADQATANLAQSIKSAGRESEFSAEGLNKVAKQLEEVTNISGETIKGVLSMQMKFRDLKGDEFKRLTEAALDMSVRMKTDAVSAVNALGLAMKNPERNIQALTRAGVTLSTQQKELAKHFKATGEEVELQRLILGEAEKAFQGAANAAAQASGGGLKQVSIILQRIKEDLGHELMPALDHFVPALKFMADETAKSLKDLSTELGKMATEWAKAFDISPAEALVGAFAILRNEVEKLLFSLTKVGAALRFAQLNVKDAFPGVDLTPEEKKQRAFDAATLLKTTGSSDNAQIFKDAVIAFREAVLKDKQNADREEARSKGPGARVPGEAETAFGRAFPKVNIGNLGANLAFGADVAGRTAQNLVPAWAEKMTNSLISIVGGRDTAFDKITKATDEVKGFFGGKLLEGFKGILGVAAENMPSVKEKPFESRIENFQTLFQRIQTGAASGDSPAKKTAAATAKTADHAEKTSKSLEKAAEFFGIGIPTFKKIAEMGGLG